MIKPKAKRILTIFTCLRFLGTFSCAFKTLVNKGCRYPCPSMEIQGFSSGFVVGQSPAHKPLYSTTPDGMDGARHSYVEGSTFDNRLAEIEAMGGDPFFLDDEEASTVEIVKGEKESTPWPGTLDQGTLSVQANKFSATDGNGPTPRKSENTVENNDSDWEWDGTIDEDAHLGLE